MSSISTAVELTDRMSYPLHSITSALDSTLNVFEDFKSSLGETFDDSKINSARISIDEAKASISAMTENMNQASNGANNFSNNINNASNYQDQFNRKLEEGTRASGSFLKSLMGFGVIQKIFGMVTSQVDSAIERMDTLNNYPKVMSNLGISTQAAEKSMDMLSENLKGLPTTLNDAVSAVQRFTSANGNVGASTKMFLALNNAILAGGATTQVQQSALEQLSQAYAKGKPDMMEWRTAMMAMPAQLKQVAKAMGYIDANALGEALREGKVSMNEFMNTFIELNEKGANGFQSLEEQARNATGGFATSIANMKAAVTRGITSLIDGINSGLKRAGFGTIQSNIQNLGKGIEKMLAGVGKMAGNVIYVLSPALHLIQEIANFIQTNWSVIAPIVIGIAAAFGVYNAILAAHAIAVGISTAVEWLHSVATYAQAKALLANVNANLLATSSEYALAVATASATVAQTGFNTALWACPVVWIIALIIALIAVLAYLWFTNDDVAYGILYAWDALMIGLQVVGLGIQGIWYGLQLAAMYLWLGIQTVLLGLMGAWYGFQTGVEAVCLGVLSIFQGLYNGIVSIVNGIISVLNKIPGVNIDYAETAHFADDFSANMQENMIDRNQKLQDMASQMDGTIEQINTMKSDFASKLSAGATAVQNDAINRNNTREDRVAHRNDWVDGAKNAVSSALDSFDFDDMLDNNNTLNNINGNTGKISDSLDVSEEDLKYLIDLAERDTINRFTTAEIKIEMNNNNNINSEMDLDGIVDYLANGVNEAMEKAAEGVHE